MDGLPSFQPGVRIKHMKAVIYQPAKNVMQSGRGKAALWILEYDKDIKRMPDPLMGWTSCDSTTGQVRMKFDSLDEATSFAEKNGLEYRVKLSSVRKVRPRNYSDNFKYVPFDDKAGA